jgi:hypothetical protein
LAGVSCGRLTFPGVTRYTVTRILCL